MLTVKPRREFQTDKLSKVKAKPLPLKYSRRPFWLPASNYYVLTAAVAGVVFFFVWGILLLDGGDDMPWIWSGLASSVVLGGAVFVREIILRKARMRYLLTEKRLDASIKGVPAQAINTNTVNKLTVEKNAAVIKEIRQKSEAARALGKSSDAHLEIFEICGEYLALNRQQLETVGIGSPRLAALRRGKEIVQSLHRFHLLSWAESESRRLTQESKIRVTISDKLEAARRALSVLDSALSHYPDEPRLVESEKALREFSATIKVSHWIEQAERAAFRGNYKRAINHYRDALFFMARDATATDAPNDERRLTAERINAEIKRLREFAGKKLEENN